MPLRFRRSLKIPQGIKLNFGKMSGTEKYNAGVAENISHHKNVMFVCWIFFLTALGFFIDKVRTDQPLATTVPLLLFFGILAFRPVYYFVRRLQLQKKIAATCASVSRENIDTVEQLIGKALANLDLISETTADYEISPDGKALYVDIRLPDIRIMYKRFKAPEAVAADYSAHVHGIVIRIAETSFALFPTVETVLCSGYYTHRNTPTGMEQDEYILSVIFDRERWEKSDPAGSVPEEFIEQFPYRRKVGERGFLEVITPLSPTVRKRSAAKKRQI